jgi:hypothetical protein
MGVTQNLGNLATIYFYHNITIKMRLDTLLVVVTAWAHVQTAVAQPHATSAPSVAPTPAPGTFANCSICGNFSQTVAFVNKTVLFGTLQENCGHLQQLGFQGQLSDFVCASFQTNFAVACGCFPGTSPTSPVAPTTPAPSSAPTICYVCGNSSFVVGSPNNTIKFPTVALQTCADVQNKGLGGIIPAAFCAITQAGVEETCNCTLQSPTSAPVAPTVAPVNPTKAPVVSPVTSVPPVLLVPKKTSKASKKGMKLAEPGAPGGPGGLGGAGGI